MARRFILHAGKKPLKMLMKEAAVTASKNATSTAEERFMSIINKPPEMVKREYDLQESVEQAVEKCATFIQRTPDHVVSSRLKMVIWKDAEFRRWRKQQQTDSERKEGTAPSKAAKA
jgi:hypothetical protein